MMDHLGSRKVNAFVGGFFGLLLDVGAAAARGNTGGAFTRTLNGAGAKAYSQEFETEADMVGLYLASRAGFDIDKAPMLWRRMAAEHPASIEGSFTAIHPSTPERFVSMENVIRKTTTAKRWACLVPDRKERPALRRVADPGWRKGGSRAMRQSEISGNAVILCLIPCYSVFVATTKPPAR